MSFSAALRPAYAAVLAGLASSLTGCDVVQGFKNAGDALFPPVKTYLDAPGYRLVEGGYRDLILLTSSELFVLARSAKQSDTALYSVRYAVPNGCSIPEVGHFWAGGKIEIGAAWIAYFHDNTNFGTLSFADTRCRVSPLTLPDAELPKDTYITPPDGDAKGRMQLLVRSEGRLLKVDPELASYEVVAEKADYVLPGVGKGGVSVVIGDGRVQTYDRDWKYIDSFADGVTALAPVDGSLFVESPAGIQRATPVSHDGKPAIDLELISADGCKLGFPNWSQHWLAFMEPCDSPPRGDDPKLAILDLDTHETTYPSFTVDDPRALTLTVRAGTVEPPTPDAGVWAFFLRNDGTGTLVARSPDGKELVLGQNAALEKTKLDPTEDYGYALVSVSESVGRFVRWDFEGHVTTLGENVMRDSPNVSFADLTMDYDGTAGTLAQLVNGELVPVLERVPTQRFAYKDVNGRQALFSDFDGKNGTLSIGELACTPGTDCARQYYVPHAVARGVHQYSHAFLDETEAFLPGIGFLDQYDDELRTGRFQYSNLELEFTSIVSEGVSDFTYAGNGILYAVPYGEGAGIWLARAK